MIYSMYNVPIAARSACLEPMMMTHPLKSCLPFWKVCEKHNSCPMMQIFSLELTCSVDGPIQLYDTWLYGIS